MFGGKEDLKLKMRKKALEMDSKESPALAIMIKKKSEMSEAPSMMEEQDEEMNPLEAMASEESMEDGEEGAGFESMMVSPEEKKMLMSLRQKHKAMKG